MDHIHLQNISVPTHIGVPEVERKTEQTILVSVKLFHSLKTIGQSDDITKGIDYASVTADIVELGKTERKTVERFAEDIAAVLLKNYKPEGGVEVTVAKNPDLPLQSASVTILRP